MKVLVTGGSGFLGINLIRKLLEKGIEDIISLDLIEFDYTEKDKINGIVGDIRNVVDVEKAMAGVDIVIHTAAALPLYTKEEIYTIDVEGTRTLLKTAHKFNVDRFVMISSTAVYGIPDHHPLYENDKLIGVGPYGEAKIKAEEVCVEFKKKGMCIPILRPKSFIGPERLGVFALFYDWAKDGKNFPMIGSGNNRYQLFDVEDLCDSIYLCMTKDKSIVNDIYNVGAKEFTTMKEDYQAVLDKAGFGKKIIGFPAWPMITILRILEFFKLSPLYKWVYETACEDSFVSIEKAEQKLGFKPKYSNKDALLRNYKWYLDNFKNFEGASGISHRVPWKQGILRFFKIFF
ncbi:MAG: NAD-dependent epimerase/dehydratase family protein [Candidatus Omnitrophica bacterium]|nr:NAD-dependent epimerase/dehydratase family protein [Candidatus Omnitrophota bacterium]MBU1997762.1 NAD-dependent epimerase/dehydratase family protein [Candidatus Omnitrophota bacterium]MBU4334802.1 NAD-dependent epimerase/dehydratase family protein [Candidatus Omnitrophota bacterium]